MLKKMMVSLMAVMVFAIPIVASAEVSDVDKAKTYFLEFRDDGTNYGGSLVQIYSDVPIVFTLREGNIAPLYGNANYSVYVDGVYDSNSHNTNYMFYFDSLLIDPVKTPYVVSSHPITYNDGTVFFTAPTPPEPIVLGGVETVEEIPQQAVKVVGGVILVASIILGLWLLIGLVRRLMYSYLR